VKIGPVVSAENSLTNGNCAATQLQFDDHHLFVVLAFENELDYRQPFSISSHMYGDYKTDISFVVAQGTLLW